MLLIIFLSFVFICQPSTASWKGDLDYYDANSQVKIIRKWYNLVNTPLDESTALKQLKGEAKSASGSMNDHLQKALKSNKRVSLLTEAENLAVIMCTSKFYKEYVPDTTNGNWEKYRVFTTLLVSALRKLAKIDPIRQGTTLYRGIDFRPDPPTSGRIFWKSFTSTTLDIEVAKKAAGSGGTILEFQVPASSYAAKVGKLSSQPDEVLLLPFEAFDFLKADDDGFHFKASKTQELLGPAKEL